MRDANELRIVGCASGVAGADIHSGDGPLVIKKSPYLTALKDQGLAFRWDDMFRLQSAGSQRVDESLHDLYASMATKISSYVRDQQYVNVIGGDHSCAIGTWSGVYDALHAQGELGLIWIDAHMDSHTPETSESGRIHGMPLAALLGYGYPTLTGILHDAPKFKPENVCLIGVRSYEKGEAALLERLKLRVYFMDEVKDRGFDVVLREAVQRVTKNTVGYGVTIDLDSIDPNDAPGVDVPEVDGISASDMRAGLAVIAADPRLVATEIVEYDPLHDQDQKTEKLTVDLLKIIMQGRQG